MQMQSLFRRSAASAVEPAPLPMLSFPGKKPLRFTGDTSAAEMDEHLAGLMRARQDAVLVSESANAGSAAINAALGAYLRHIYAVEVLGPRVPQEHALRFPWRDAEGGGGKKSGGRTKANAVAAEVQGHASLATEKAVALFALAAELARSAAAEERRRTEGIRRACSALCDAAGALSAAAAAARHAAEGSGMCHMTDACLAALERLMLAQALECYFELAVAGGKPAALCSKIARQVSIDYRDVSATLATLQQQQHHHHHHQGIDKSWVLHAQAKAAYFHAAAGLLCGRALRERGVGAAGEAVARLRQVVSVLAAAAKGPLKNPAPAAVRDAAVRLRREVEAELAAADKDNGQIFYERVPAADALPALPALPQPLVRPTALEQVLLKADC